MDVKTYRSYTDDSALRLPPAQFAPRLLGSLDPFINALDERFPEAVDGVANRLTELTRAETPAGLPARAASFEEQAIAPRVHVERYPELHAVHADLIRGLLGVDGETLLVAESVEMSQQRLIRVRFVPCYLKLVALTEAVGREPAIDFVKAYLDRIIAESPSRPGGPETLAELRERQIEFNLQEQGMDWTQAILGEHQYLNKVTVCRIQKVLVGYDPELMDVVACYPDFAMLRRTHPSFALTRTQTLMRGGTCCDTCYHDERYVDGFEHPPMSVFDNLAGPATG